MRLAAGVARRVGLDLPPLPPGEPGDPGLFGPTSIVWRIGRERVLMAGGQAALLLQLAHPLVAAGVVEHSGFRRDPLARLRATLQAVLTISFGDRRQSEQAAAGVRATHRRVRGRLPVTTGRFAAGTPYDAADPNLALWVHATLIVTALDSYHLFVRALTRDERARYYHETAPFAELFGVGPGFLPSTYGGFEEYVASVVEGPDIAVGPQARAAADGVLRPPLPFGLLPAGALARVVTAGMLPAPVRSGYALTWGLRQRATLAAVARTARVALPTLPAPVRYWSQYLVAMARAGS
jgi:uncharacterized protein (DUF2236 family)